MITLEFSYRGGMAGRLVRATTWSWASHVDFVLPDGRLLGAVPGGGVSRRDWAPAVRAERYAADCHPLVLDIALDQLGKPYDWLGVLGVGLHHDWRSTGRWFCSELVAWAFAKAGKPLLIADQIDRITPRDLLLSPVLIKA